LNSDWIPGLPPERLDILKRCLPSHQAIARPVDYFDSVMPAIWLTTDDSQTVRRDVLGLYNWDGEAQTMTYDAGKAGLSADRTYYAFDFWNKSVLPSFKGNFRFEVPAESCRVIAVRAAEDHPVLVSTSRHVTQGMVDVSDEKWDQAAGRLSGTSKVVANDPYELRIAGLGDDKPGKWSLLSAVIPAPAVEEGGTIRQETAQPGEDGWIRVLITSKKSGAISWTMKFVRDQPPQTQFAKPTTATGY
jgi:hypothetical protein